MKTFKCVCGQIIYFDNTHCLNCGERVGFDPASMDMVNTDLSGHQVCHNSLKYNVCNWVIEKNESGPLCKSCRITHITPNLSTIENIKRWRILESAKRRLLYSLLKLNLPIAADPVNKHPALGFEFLEDQSTNPLVAEEYVRTGHTMGVITINTSEADDVQREITRSLMKEAYRTPLGHCRHESGHYFYDRLIKNSEYQSSFVALFGDAGLDYEAALADYYSNPPRHQPEAGYISLYAHSHPLEDWAECWAHYLHIIDTLETARNANIIDSQEDDWIHDWLRLSVILNELNSSMGQSFAYPFVLTQRVIIKLRFIHQVAGQLPPS
mgnify:FL=1